MKKLYVSDLRRLRPGAVVKCKHDRHYKILSWRLSGSMRVTDLGYGGKGKPFDTSIGPANSCLPMQLVTIPCIFGTDVL